MTDITMCTREECPAKDKCWRHTAPATPYYQSFFAPPYSEIQDGKCWYFWDNSFSKEKENGTTEGH